jgi:uncharacterized membrane protein YeaQ/YmgE (transglycosylase-associated protein family)
MSEEKHPLRTGIIASIIAAIIWSFFPGWSWTLWALSRVLIWRIPVWLILLIGSAIFLFLVWLNRKVTFPIYVAPEFHAYNQDRFFNAIWRWSYSGSGLPRDAASFCPKCDMQLVYHEPQGAYRAAGLISTVLICERCGEQITNVEGDYNHLERRVLREIERKVRTEEYKDVSTAQ